MGKTKSQNYKDWRKQAREKGKVIRRSKKPPPPPSVEYLQELIRQNTKIIPKAPVVHEVFNAANIPPHNPKDNATYQDITQRIQEQDTKYWNMLTQNRRMTLEWKNYGKKHSERISEKVYFVGRSRERK